MVDGKGKTIYAGNASKNYLQVGFKIGIFPQKHHHSTGHKKTLFSPIGNRGTVLSFFFVETFLSVLSLLHRISAKAP